MIVQLRIDERLIHGQIVTSWSRFLEVNAIVVANDEAASNEMTSQMLLMTAPTGMKVVIKSITDAVKLLADPRSEKMRILVIVDCPKDAIEVVKALKIKDVNVANYIKKKSDEKVSISGYCRADREDFALFEELASISENIYAQMLPTYAKEDLRALLQKAKTEFK
jgi:mannose/fructose/N-acetylgalactosamine-specific phosphotransferase system component IIB